LFIAYTIWKDWFETSVGNEEFRWFAYVAFSRRKHLLVVATPKLNDCYLERFKAYGFVPKEKPG